ADGRSALAVRMNTRSLRDRLGNVATIDVVVAFMISAPAPKLRLVSGTSLSDRRPHAWASEASLRRYLPFVQLGNHQPLACQHFVLFFDRFTIVLSDLMALSRLSAKLLGSLAQQRRHICARLLTLSASSDWPHHDPVSHPSMESRSHDIAGKVAHPV